MLWSPAEMALVLFAYALGSICMGPILAGRAGVDLRAVGSGNVGATNVARALGGRAGRATMAWDAAKGALPAILARFWIAPFGPGDTPGLHPTIALAAVGCAAVLGHCFPVFHGFRGGKGVATSAGVLLVAVPAVGGLALITYGIAKRLSGRASVAAFFACGVAVFVTAFFAPRPLFAMTVGIVALVVLRHHENIGRLARGEEPRSP